MDDEEDDLYGANGEHARGNKPVDDGGSERMDEASEDGSGSEEESDSDIEIVTEKKDGDILPPPKPAHQSSRIELRAPPTSDPKPQPRRTVSPPQVTKTSPSARPLTLPTPTSPHAPVKPGSSYPPIRTSSIELSGPALNPFYPPASKPIRDLDLDADVADKAWRAPGADQTDYFNYGFDEFTWTTYVLRQRELREFSAGTKAQVDSSMAMMMGGAGGGAAGPQNGVGGAGAGAAAAAAAAPMGPMGLAMPDEQQMMQMMQQAMSQQGVSDPGQMDFAAFMQMNGMGGMPGMPPMMPGMGAGAGGQQQQQAPWNQGGGGGGAGAGAGGGGYGQGGGKGRGRGRW